MKIIIRQLGKRRFAAKFDTTETFCSGAPTPEGAMGNLIKEQGGVVGIQSVEPDTSFDFRTSGAEPKPPRVNGMKPLVIDTTKLPRVSSPSAAKRLKFDDLPVPNPLKYVVKSLGYRIRENVYVDWMTLGDLINFSEEELVRKSSVHPVGKKKLDCFKQILRHYGLRFRES